MACVRGARFNMIAVVERGSGTNDITGTTDTNDFEYEWVQDPVSGAMERVPVPVDNPSTPTIDESQGRRFEVPCMARGVIDGGIRVAGTTTRFDEVYEATDWVKITFGPNDVVTRRDRVVEIKDRKTKKPIWVEEEAGFKPTIFNVMGVTPVVDPFGHHVENFALLQRNEVQ